MAAEEQKVEGCAVEAVSVEGMRGRLRGGGVGEVVCEGCGSGVVGDGFGEVVECDG